MRKKFTLLITVAALLLGSGGMAWGQMVEPGNDLGPYRNQNVSPAPVRYDYSARGTAYSTHHGMIKFADTTYVGSYSRSCCIGVSVTAQNLVAAYANVINVYIPINSSTWSNPNYYNYFKYDELWVYGYDASTSASGTCSGGGSCSGTGPVLRQKFPTENIIVAAGTDVRLANNIQKTTTNNTTNLQLPTSTQEYSIRFDAAYTGTGENYAGVTITPNASAADNWTIFRNGQGLGFWTGITSAQTFSIIGGGTDNGSAISGGDATPDGQYGGTRFMIGNQTQNQNRVTIDTDNGPVYVFNYQTGHDVVYGYQGNQPAVTVQAGNLYIRNDNYSGITPTCYALTFTPLFNPNITGSGSIRINDNGSVPTDATNPQTLSTTRGATTFTVGATFAFGANTGELLIEGGSVTFNGPYTYSSTGGGRDFIAAKGSCVNGDITFNNGAVSVTRDDAAPTLWIARRDIYTTTNAPVTYDISGVSKTDWRAGRDINLDSSVDFLLKGSGKSTWYAMQDILTNQTCIPKSKSGAVLFDVTGTSDVEWNATRNINTKGRVDIKYAATTATGTLTLKSDTGNIQTERQLTIDVNENLNDIKISAESLQGVNAQALGNIYTYDSVRITRGNGGPGTTEILSQNFIRTAMVDIENKVASANDYLIESHMGDIEFGYNTNIGSITPYVNPSLVCSNPSASATSYNLNYFKFTAPDASTGSLKVYAGFDDMNASKIPWGGGNIRFTRIKETLGKNSNHPTEFKIPFSNWYYCGDGTYDIPDYYENAGIIGGIARCQLEDLSDPCFQLGLDYQGFNGELLFDAGTRGNIIINNGAYLTFQGGNGNAKFLTRWGDIDMRYPFDVDSMQGSLLFLANSELHNKLNTGNCTCEEKRNNVYLQDFQYNPVEQSGSIFIGADNNIKLQYGGLVGSAWGANQRDPFYSDGAGYLCGQNYHCDSKPSENQARDLILNFSKTTAGTPTDITSGGFAAVASDLIDIYKNMIYIGGEKGSGMSAVPGYGNLHGESVAGYGLYIKTQANKKNWDHNAFSAEIDACWPPKCDDPCDFSILQNVARVTFHSDARINAENQRVYIGSPVLETFGNLDLNTHDNKGAKTSITIQTDSLIVHDSLIIDGKLTRFTTWSGLYRDMPIVKLGHHRFTPPFVEMGDTCAQCFIHQKEKGTYTKRTALDTLYVTFRNGANMDRLHTLVADHAVISFLTDSFDHVKGDPTLNAKFFTDTFKVRNHVELWADSKHERDGHFELVSEAQMNSKDYAGIYSRHLHMEPIAPTCARDYPYSQLWLQDPALDVITTSTFGGYGWIHADVHVEIEATLAPGFASLRSNGDYCYELGAGTLKMQDLRLDKGAQLRYSIGHKEGRYKEKVDCIDVDEITLYGSIDVIVEKRCGQQFEEGCYPILYYNSVAVDTVNLNNLKLKTKQLDGYLLTLNTSVPGVVYLCVGNVTIPSITRTVTIPQVEGVTTTPEAGTHRIFSYSDFKFKAKYTTEKPLKVMTGRVIDGKDEELFGTLNENGEYEYVIRQVAQNLVLSIGPDFATGNMSITDGAVVWSHNNTIYIRVEKEDIASIYSIAGQMVRRIDLQEGSTPVPMERGVYVVTLKDGSVHKVIVK